MHAATAMLEPLWYAENALGPDDSPAELHQRKVWLEGGTLTLRNVIGKVTNQPMALFFEIDDILTTSHAFSLGVDVCLEVLRCFNGDAGDLYDASTILPGPGLRCWGVLPQRRSLH
jgi:hypothetical protein